MAVILVGCSASHVAEQVIRSDRYAFSEAIARSWDEQLLLNLVRLRYRDNPLFLEMGSIVTTYSVSGAAGVGGTINLGGDTKVALTPSLGVAMAAIPTMTYAPLQGEEFAVRFLSPITPATILLLSQSGWSLERLFVLCVQRANGVSNATSASGPTPDIAPEFSRFHRLTEALRALQRKELLDVHPDSAGRTVSLRIREPRGVHEDSAAATVRSILDLDSSARSFAVTGSPERNRTDEIAVTGRSLLSVMFFLSQAVEVPEADVHAGKVTVTRREDGTAFDWSEVTGRVLHIHCSESEPADAAISVAFRGHWFSIDDSDLNSKSTFNLLNYLFNLKAATKGNHEPLLTYPVR